MTKRKVLLLVKLHPANHDLYLNKFIFHIIQHKDFNHRSGNKKRTDSTLPQNNLNDDF